MDAPYFGISKGGRLFNYAEGAMYVGLLPLILAAFAFFRRGAPSFATNARFLAFSRLSPS